MTLSHLDPYVAASAEKQAAFGKLMDSLGHRLITNIQPNFMPADLDPLDLAPTSMPISGGGGKAVMIGLDGKSIDIDDPTQNGFVDIGGGTYVDPKMLGFPLAPAVPAADTSPIPTPILPSLSVSIYSEGHDSYSYSGPSSYNYSWNDDYLNLQGVQTDGSIVVVGYGDHYSGYGDGYASVEGGPFDTQHWSSNDSHSMLSLSQWSTLVEIAPGMWTTVPTTEATLTYSANGASNGIHNDGSTHNSSNSDFFSITVKETGGSSDLMAILGPSQQLLSQPYMDVGSATGQLINVMNGMSPWDQPVMGTSYGIA